VTVPKFLLDPKAGFLELVIRRVHAGVFGPGGGQSLSFVPAMQRCFEWDSAETLRLADGQTMTDNVNLTFGASGFAFAEPGTYDVEAVLVLTDETQEREFIAKSEKIRLRIAAPKTHDEERDAIDFFSDDVGLYLALGGSKALTRARGKLTDIVNRRGGDTSDPLVAHITRAFAIDESRAYVRYQDGKFGAEGADLNQAVKLIDNLGGQMATFDAATARATQELAQRWRQKLSGKPAESGPVAPAVTTAPPENDDEPTPLRAKRRKPGRGKR
jgi:hypothetical protein